MPRKIGKNLIRALRSEMRKKKVQIFTSTYSRTRIILSRALSKVRGFRSYPKPISPLVSLTSPTLSPSPTSNPNPKSSPLWSPRHPLWDMGLKLYGGSEIVTAVAQIAGVGIRQGADEMKNTMKSGIGLGKTPSEMHNELVKLIQSNHKATMERFDAQERKKSSSATGKSGQGLFGWLWGKNAEENDAADSNDSNGGD